MNTAKSDKKNYRLTPINRLANVGEVFIYGGKRYTVEQSKEFSCSGCSFMYGSSLCKAAPDCSITTFGQSVVFKKLSP